jgi:hypothetical protein
MDKQQIIINTLTEERDTARAELATLREALLNDDDDSDEDILASLTRAVEDVNVGRIQPARKLLEKLRSSAIRAALGEDE